ncbi:unnamed protein product [Calicophoron daubneyi]|uniref:Beta-galactosidase n=1 Tax=Calicophoron daubneyi TaxID=300641 RepID=A0AAV2TJK0_CALDB
MSLGVILLLLVGLLHFSMANPSFYVDYQNHTLIKDGKPFQYISGSFHYFRIPSEYWEDRLHKAKLAGLDAVQMYVAWNFHEEQEGVYNFEGNRDLVHFIELIAKQEMLAIVRAGPYICAEWRYGGLPPWLLSKNPKMKIRTSDPEYMTYVNKWLEVLLPKLRPYLYENGGPIIMVQLENEYGSYGTCDSGYMSSLYNTGREHLGDNVVLFTTDGRSQRMLQCGSSDLRYLTTIDFGPTGESTEQAFAPLEKYRAGLPWINSEFYVGWFDIWGGRHSKTSMEAIGNTLKKLVTYSKRVSVNMYMFHGGTTFGFWNGISGANVVSTSYDFDALLSEAGDVTPKYAYLQKLIYDIKGSKPPPLPNNTTKAEYGTIPLEYISHILLEKGEETVSADPLTMEALNQYEGFMIYKVALPKLEDQYVTLEFERFEDIAHIFTTDGQTGNFHFHISLNYPRKSAILDLSTLDSHDTLVILMENSGYWNFGGHMWNNVKGIAGKVLANGKELKNWKIVPVKNPFGSNSTDEKQNGWYLPVPGSMFAGEFTISKEEDRHDTFLQLNNFTRGVAEVNGNILGKYNQARGPQLRLYIPRQFLKVGSNRVVVTELGWIIGIPSASFFKETLWKN